MGKGHGEATLPVISSPLAVILVMSDLTMHSSGPTLMLFS